jgi:hypothetical protein
MEGKHAFSLAARGALVAFLGWLTWGYLRVSMTELGDSPGFMHRVNLVFHEAGHAVLCWSPPLLHSLGGTLGQLAMPLGLAIAFAVKNRDPFGAAACAWWTGQSLVDVAPYVNDARILRLELLGGGTGDEIEGHDWNFILSEIGHLDWDVPLGHGILLAGRAIMVAALAFAAGWIAWRALRPGDAAA